MQQKIKFKPECLAWSCHYATGCFVTFLGDISILKSGCNTKKLFCCPGLELFHFLLLWNTVIFVSSRAFLLSTPLDNSEDTRKILKYATNNLFSFYIGAIFILRKDIGVGGWSRKWQFSLTLCTLESGINIPPWINIAPGTFGKNNKHSPLNKHSRWKIWPKE